MDSQDRAPSGSLPQRFIGKLRAMRADIDEMIEYLQRIEGSSQQSDGTARRVNNRYAAGKNISKHIIPFIRMNGPQTRRQILDEMRSGGRPVDTNDERALGFIKTSLSQSINHGTIVRIGPETYDVAENYTPEEIERFNSAWQD